jgi:hypothetical protein
MHGHVQASVLRRWRRTDVPLSRAVALIQNWLAGDVYVPGECEHNHGERHRETDEQPAMVRWSC